VTFPSPASLVAWRARRPARPLQPPGTVAPCDLQPRARAPSDALPFPGRVPPLPIADERAATSPTS
jgi:hypothetical protein